jgi:hypothetical protein
MNLVQPLSTGSASKPVYPSSHFCVLHYAESVVWTRRERERVFEEIYLWYFECHVLSHFSGL